MEVFNFDAISENVRGTLLEPFVSNFVRCYLCKQAQHNIYPFYPPKRSHVVTKSFEIEEFRS